jgi:tRNA-Thr(GGU) m(6)t(6)A37 methyltransferase TsaA
MVQARERGREAAIEIAPAFRPGLAGLERVSHIVVLTWLHGAPRDLIVQQPRHAPEPHGTFALRSPARPNPVGLHMVRIVSLDVEGGIIGIDAIDVLDGTPVIDIKPYYASTDSIPDAVTAG